MDLSKLPVEGGVRQCGEQVTRLETSVDAAFAFAVPAALRGLWP
jgi:hypothetical protein